MFEVTLSHILPNGSRKFKAPTLEAAKTIGDVEYSGVKLPQGRNGAAPFGIIVTDQDGIVAWWRKNITLIIIFIACYSYYCSIHFRACFRRINNNNYCFLEQHCGG